MAAAGMAVTCCAASTTPAEARCWPATSSRPTARSCSPTTHRGLLDGLSLPGCSTCPRGSGHNCVRGRPELTPHREVTATDTFMRSSPRHQWRAGRPSGRAHDGAVRCGSGSAAEITADDVHTCRCRCSTQRADGGLVGGVDRGCGDGAGHVLGVRAARRLATLRRHLSELCRQAAGLRAGHP